MDPEKKMTIVRLLMLPGLLILAWYITGKFVYSKMTSRGEAYYNSLITFKTDATSVKSIFDYTYIVRKNFKSKSCTIIAESQSVPIWTAVSQLGPNSLQLTLETNPGIAQSLPSLASKRTIEIVSLKDAGLLWPFNKDIQFERPTGPLAAEMRAVATKIASSTSSGLKPESASEIAEETVRFIDECHDLNNWGTNHYFLRLISGPIEAAIIVLGVFCFLIFLAELSLALIFNVSTTMYAVRASEEILDLIPYVGFFGTILGMSEALWILGKIDISDSLQKATQIGPITGNISLAMETSQLGLIFFIFASLIGAIIRIAFRHPA